MSKEKPEVGDVWEYKNGVKFVIIRQLEPHPIDVLEGKNEYRYVVIEDCEEFNLLYEWAFYGGCYKYLGKSKVSIKELFDVRD